VVVSCYRQAWSFATFFLNPFRQLVEDAVSGAHKRYWLEQA
jgi:hypothetical protein